MTSTLFQDLVNCPSVWATTPHHPPHAALSLPCYICAGENQGPEIWFLAFKIFSLPVLSRRITWSFCLYPTRCCPRVKSNTHKRPCVGCVEILLSLNSFTSIYWGMIWSSSCIFNVIILYDNEVHSFFNCRVDPTHSGIYTCSPAGIYDQVFQPFIMKTYFTSNIYTKIIHLPSRPQASVSLTILEPPVSEQRLPVQLTTTSTGAKAKISTILLLIASFCSSSTAKISSKISTILFIMLPLSLSPFNQPHLPLLASSLDSTLPQMIKLPLFLIHQFLDHLAVVVSPLKNLVSCIAWETCLK